MGLTFVDLKIASLAAPDEAVADSFLVDSGAAYTVLPEAIWKKLAIQPRDAIRIGLADGRSTIRPTGFAFITFEGQTVPTRVILGEPDDSRILGVVTLEEMGLVFNALKRTLAPMDVRM